MTESSSRRGRDSLAKHVLIALAAAVVIYLVAFYTVEHLRTRKGGWHVAFATDAGGSPHMVVEQPWLGISNVSFGFPNQRIASSNLASVLVFDQPITNVPFGKLVYFDTTFLPGSLVFDLFGHEI